ncbi:MAG: hypothetical protein GXO76_15490 [Calditrichaeota bacterium]|nr:hypothetical protein [Calditrichota bacterium]
MNPFQTIFHLLWMKNLPCSAVRVNWQPEPVQKPAALLRAEKAFWHELLEKHPAAHLFNGPLAELESFRIEESRLFLNLRPSDYRAFMYSNFHRQEILHDYARQFVNQGLGISAVVRTGDGTIVLMKRSEQVGEYPGMLDVFGGHIEPGRHTVNGLPDPCLGIREELREELGLSSKDIRDLRVIGMIRNAETTKPELVFLADSSLSVEDLREKAKRAADAGEYDSLVPVADTRGILQNYLAENADHFSPSGLGSLWVYAHL